MSVMKYAFAALQEPKLDQRHWELLHGERRGQSATRFASTKFAVNKYLLSHVTIMASCAMEPAPFSHLIRPESSHLVNHNWDFWPNDALKMSFHTFKGSFNFVEHYQNTKASKGTIVDAVLRKVRLGPDPDSYVFYVDLLVATDLTHEDLVARIKSGEVKYLSMGCVCDVVFCSLCGAQGPGDTPPCIHLTDLYKGRFKPDQWGIPRIVAEGCGSADLPGGGVRFVEASWVERPAFAGAVTRTILADDWELPESIVPKAASLVLPGIPKAASLITTALPELPSSQIERPDPRVISELRRLR